MFCFDETFCRHFDFRSELCQSKELFGQFSPREEEKLKSFSFFIILKNIVANLNLWKRLSSFCSILYQYEPKEMPLFLFSTFWALWPFFLTQMMRTYLILTLSSKYLVNLAFSSNSFVTEK